jgi:hypothetical protein
MPVALTTRLALGAAAGALVLSACSATNSGDDGEQDAERTGPGVTAESIKVGFVTLKNAAGGGGFVSADQGDTQAQVDAMVAAINESGGILGRNARPVLVPATAMRTR